jgi:hypothetical protein
MIPFSPSFAEYGGKLRLRLHHRWSTPLRAASSFPTHTHTHTFISYTHIHTFTQTHTHSLRWSTSSRAASSFPTHTHTHTHTFTSINVCSQIFKLIDSVLSSANKLSLVCVCMSVSLPPLCSLTPYISHTLECVCVCVSVRVSVRVCVWYVRKKEQEKEESTSALTCK